MGYVSLPEGNLPMIFAEIRIRFFSALGPQDEKFGAAVKQALEEARWLLFVGRC